MMKRNAMACMADGGKVPGRGAGDKVHALLDPREIVMPPDTVRKVGARNLLATIHATHKPSGKHSKGPIRKMGDGGMARPVYFADGGLVEEERKRQIMGSQLAAQIPNTDSGFKSDPNAQPVTGNEVTRNVMNTLSAVAPGTVGALSRAAVGAGRVASAAGVAPYAPVAAGGTTLLASTPSAGPATAATPAVRPSSPNSAASGAFNNAADSQAAYPLDRQTVNVPNGYNGPQGNPTTFDPSVTKTVDAQGRVLYSNVPSDTGFANRGTVSPQNMTAADNLAARSAQEAQGAIARLAQPSQPAQPAPAYIAPDSTDYNPFANFGKSNAGLSAREVARQANARAIAADQSATSRANAQTSAAVTLAGQQISADTSRYGVDTQAGTAARRLALDSQNAGVSNANTKASTDALTALEAAKSDYAAAQASGDAKRVQKAEDALRARQGKYEKEAPELFTTTAIPAGIDPVTGQPRGAGAIVTNKRTGETRIISADEAKGQSTPKYETGKVYQDAKGNKAKWDGAKFVPA